MKKEEVKEHVIPVTGDDSERKMEPNPYADVIQALTAVQVAEQAQAAAKIAINATAYEAAAAAAAAAARATQEANLEANHQLLDSTKKQRSPSPNAEGWTFVDEEKKLEAHVDLGAKPKNPPLQVPSRPSASSLHPGDFKFSLLFAYSDD